jgi:hypothetical protein
MQPAIERCKMAAPAANPRGPTRRRPVPTYLDIHDIPGVKAADVAGAHELDVKVQGQYGVNYKHYWVDEEAGKVFCLVDAPDRETATRVHREAHGLEAHTLHEVEQGA